MNQEIPPPEVFQLWKDLSQEEENGDEWADYHRLLTLYAEAFQRAPRSSEACAQVQMPYPRIPGKSAAWTFNIISYVRCSGATTLLPFLPRTPSSMWGVEQGFGAKSWLDNTPGTGVRHRSGEYQDQWYRPRQLSFHAGQCSGTLAL
jgi:hypothetical protein